MTTRDEFYQAHAVDGVLSDEKMAELALMPEGESGDKPQSSEPAAAPVAKQPEAKAQETSKASEVKDAPKGDADPATLTAQNATILAKDGKHTIGYEKLEEAREREREAREVAAAATAETERLRAEMESLRKGITSASTDPKAAVGNQTAESPEKGNGKPAVDFGDYSDEAMAKAALQIERLVEGQVQQRVEAATKDIEARSLAPMAEQLAKTAVREHYQAIYTAHPDADSIAESKELSEWIDKQPNFAREAYRAALTQGETADVVELFSAFKEATGKTGAAQAEADPDKGKANAAIAAAAQAAIDRAKAKPPTSLSEIPAGSAAASDEATAMLDKSSAALMDQFEGKSPEQIHALLNRVL